MSHKALVVAEHDNNTLKAATLTTITAAAACADEVVVLVAGHNCANVTAQAATTQGVAKIYSVDSAAYAQALAEPLADLVLRVLDGDADGFTHVLAPATTFGKNLMPRVAALKDVAMLSDIIAVEAPDTFVRPIYAGNALATVQSDDALKVITARTTAFEPAGAGGSAATESVAGGEASTGSRFVSAELTESERPELTAAEIVVSGGRGLGSAENFALMEQLADKLGAAIGASRAAVDAGYVPNDYQVGQTGKVVAPKLYVAVGISGAIQHLAGMKDSKVIVAINKDPEAPIFQIADYGLEGDLFEILPELTGKL